LPLQFAGAAPFRFVPEILFFIELLFPCGKNEIRTAVNTLQHPILKFGHGPILGK
jgi:hypothetical protein